jgi:hypothetical protein
VISAHIMGSPVRRLTNPITRCWDQPHNRYAGTDDGLGTGRNLDTKRLTLMCGRFLYMAVMHDYAGGPTDRQPKLTGTRADEAKLSA